MTDTVALLPTEQKALELVKDSLAYMGYEVARVRLKGGAHDKCLQVMIDRIDGAGVGIDDCEQASVQISATLDVHDPISGAYRLEVSSPGLDRPLTRPKDFMAHVGFDVKIETRAPLGGRKRFKGVIMHASDSEAKIAATANGAPEEVVIPYSLIANAQLVLTDALLAQAQKTQSLALTQE